MFKNSIFINIIMLASISDEQKNIIDNIRNKSNIIVNAVAGSGKTTTVCWIGKTFPEMNILLLTYNRKLKNETKNRVKINNIKNIHVHNFHSFCFNNWDVCGSTDQIIHDVLDIDSDDSPEFEYNLIIIDEIQDMTYLYYSLVKHIIKSSKFPPQLCVLGDVNQTIYDFNGADSRYLTLANILLNLNDYSWTTCQLSTSYRLTSRLTDFINNVVLCKPGYIQPGNITSANVKPRYIFCDAFGIAPIKELTHHYLVKFGYNYNDIFILAPSVSSDLSPVKMLANNLSSNYNIPIFIPGSDTEKLDVESINNKLVFATFHQVKGLERKCVMIFGFDNSYFYYYKQDVNKTVCPNEIYVALTRCSERLTIFHHYKKNWLDFIDPKLINDYCYTERIQATGLDPEKNIDPDTRIDYLLANKLMRKYSTEIVLNKKPKLSVTRLLSHLPSNIVKLALSKVEIISSNVLIETKNTKIINPFDEPIYEVDPEDNFYINIKSKVASSVGINCIESVEDIIGTGIPIYYEYIKTGKINIIDWIDQYFLSSFKVNIYKSIFIRYKELRKLDKFEPENIFELVAIYLGLSNNLVHKILQISNYKFVTKQNLKLCVKRLDHHLGDTTKIKFEVYNEAEVLNVIERTINGFIDCITKDTIWEFKCLGGSIQPIHLLQLVIYGWLYWNTHRISKNMKILNILSGEKYEIKATPQQLDEVIQILIKHKYTPQTKLSDEEFIKNCLSK